MQRLPIYRVVTFSILWRIVGLADKRKSPTNAPPWTFSILWRIVGLAGGLPLEAYAIMSLSASSGGS